MLFYSQIRKVITNFLNTECTGRTHPLILEKVFNLAEIRLFGLRTLVFEPKGGADLIKEFRRVGHRDRKLERLME